MQEVEQRPYELRRQTHNEPGYNIHRRGQRLNNWCYELPQCNMRKPTKRPVPTTLFDRQKLNKIDDTEPHASTTDNLKGLLFDIPARRISTGLSIPFSPSTLEQLQSTRPCHISRSATSPYNLVPQLGQITPPTNYCKAQTHEKGDCSSTSKMASSFRLKLKTSPPRIGRPCSIHKAENTSPPQGRWRQAKY